MSLIKIENASLGYEGKTVVNDISVDIKEKDYICIVGVCTARTFRFGQNYSHESTSRTFKAIERFDYL